MAWRKDEDMLQSKTAHSAPETSLVEDVLNAVVSAGSKIVSLSMSLLAGVLVVYSLYAISDSLITQEKAKSASDVWNLLGAQPEIIQNMENPQNSTTLEALRKKYEDYRAWLTVYNTHIDYPVLQSDNDLYYASHNLNKEASMTGSIYLAAGNDGYFKDSYNIIYGHHMDNSAMFGDLDKYRDREHYPDFLENNNQALIVARDAVYDVTLFAVLMTDAYQPTVYPSPLSADGNAAAVRAFLQNLYENPDPEGKSEVVAYDAETAKTAEKIVALSTCASATTNGRLVVFGKMVKRNLLMIMAEGYDDIYDGKSHGLGSVSVTYEEGTLIEYSLDGETWTTEEPTIKDVGSFEVFVRATSETHGTDQTSVILRVRPRPVTIKAHDIRRKQGEPDPKLTATVEEAVPDGEKRGLLEGDTVNYTLRDTNTVDAPGTFKGVIVPSGLEEQGNYIIEYIPGDLIIEASAPVVTPTRKPTVTSPPAPSVTPTRKPTVTSTGKPTVTSPPVPSVTSTPAPSVTPTPQPENGPYKLTIYYRHIITGEIVAEEYIELLPEGEPYSVPSPDVPGLTVMTPVVAGIMPASDVEVTVFYYPGGAPTPPDVVDPTAPEGDKPTSPTGEPGLVILEKYKTPLGINGARLNVGDCYE